MRFASTSGTRLLPLTLLAIYCLAAPSDSRAFDSATICAWKRTWHAQYAPATPLRPYFVPRLPGRCDREVYAAGCDCADGSLYAESAAPFNCPAPGPGWMYRPEAGIGFEPVQFQRLGSSTPISGACSTPLRATHGATRCASSPPTASSRVPRRSRWSAASSRPCCSRRSWRCCSCSRSCWPRRAPGPSRRLLGVLRILGMSRRQLRGVVAWELGPIAVTAVVVGTAVGLLAAGRARRARPAALRRRPTCRPSRWSSPARGRRRRRIRPRRGACGGRDRPRTPSQPRRHRQDGGTMTAQIECTRPGADLLRRGRRGAGAPGPQPPGRARRAHRRRRRVRLGQVDAAHDPVRPRHAHGRLGPRRRPRPADHDARGSARRTGVTPSASSGSRPRATCCPTSPPPRTSRWRWPSRARRAGERAARVDELLDLLEVGDVRDRPPAEMSGGQQQRVAIAVALANAPRGALRRRADRRARRGELAAGARRACATSTSGSG